MLTTIEQLREWITDNGLKRWMLFKDYSRKEKILDSNAFPSDLQDKIAMTEKYLRRSGGYAYAAGGTTNAASEMDVVAEIRLQDEAAQPAQGVGGYPSIGELTQTITKQVRAEIEAERWKEREKEIERREKEFAEKESSTWGLIVNKLAPVAQQLISGAKQPEYRMTAGLDTKKPVHAAPIVVDEPQEEQQQGFVIEHKEKPDASEAEEETKSPWDDFTEEEGAELGELLARFKKAEPDYLTMIRKVVEMAEAGDSTYKMAKGFLVQ